MIYAHIVGWGKYLPEKIVTNDDIAAWMDTSDEWIRSRTGIAERRMAVDHETTASMAIAAAQLALDRARITPSSVDLIIVATLSPEHIFPATASIVQDALGATHAGAYDLSAACSGFIYALTMGNAMIQSGMSKVVLVIGSETATRFLDKRDRSTYPLFGDGAGAVVLQADYTPGGILASVLGSDGSGSEHLIIPAGGSKLPTSHETVKKRLHYMKMNGREVYRFATRTIGRVVKEACHNAGVDLSEIDLLIPHQANARIIASARKQIKINQEKIFMNLDKYGNTSTASIPIALCEAIEQDRIHYKDNIVLVGFGGGLTWGAIVIKWGLEMPHQPRQWWYRGIRWLVYRWAKIRSNFLRISRWLDSHIPFRSEEYPILPESTPESPDESSKSDASKSDATKSDATKETTAQNGTATHLSDIQSISNPEVPTKHLIKEIKPENEDEL
ncbi:beta-ketoacyl-ACP synthase III [Anaerolineales bacterium HSG24]|nr:beta-ketoacyl-ACP synthase III [Anaerolineales bacterium HSG24]